MELGFIDSILKLPTAELLRPAVWWGALPVGAVLLALTAVKRRWGLFFRVLPLLLLAFALAEPALYSVNKSGERVALFDVSKSISPRAQEALLEALARYQAGTDSLKVVPFADRALGRAITVERGRSVQEQLRAPLAAAADELDSGGTNIGGAVTAATAQFEGVPLLLLTDGFETAGNARQVARALALRGSSLSPIVPPEEAFLRPALSLSAMHAPLTVNQGELVEIQTTIRNTSETESTVPLEVYLDDDKLLSRAVTVPPGEERVVSTKTPPTTGGLKRIRAVLKKENSGGEELTRWLSVKTRAKLLLLSGTPQDARVLEQLFALKGYSLENIIADGSKPIPTTFENASAVVFNNVPSEALPAGFLPALRSYVATGGGVVLVGGERSFGLGRYIGTPLEEISPLRFVPPQTTKKRLNSAVILLVDKSRSMAAEGKIDSAKRAALVSIETLKSDDLIGVIGFDSAPFVVIPIAPVPEVRQMAERRLANLTAAGKTELLSALGAARQALRSAEASRKHIIVLTDGKVPDEGGAYESELSRLRTEGVTLSSVAVGGEADVPFLMMLSQVGKGAFYHALSPEELPQIFVQDIKVSTGEKTLKENEEYRVQLGPAGLRTTTGERFPPLRGVVQTVAKKESFVELVARGEETMPLLASWRYEQGRVVAFTSDANGRWSLPWLSWPGFTRFWSGIIDSVQRASTSDGGAVDFDLRYTVNRKTLTLDLAVFDEKLLTAAPPRITAEITMPGGEVRRVNFLATKRGRFETTLDEIKPGDYQIQTVYGVTKLPPVGLTLPGELFGETPGMGLDYENLSQLATLSGGAINPDPAALDQRETVTEEFTHLALPLLVLAFTLLLLEAVLRELLPRLIARSKVAVRIPASKNGLRLKKQAR